jgi:hypothetical protein
MTMLGIALAMTMAVQPVADIAEAQAWQAAIDCLARGAHEANPGAVMPANQSFTPARNAVYAVAAQCESEIHAAWASLSRRPQGSGDTPGERWLMELKEQAANKYYSTYLVPTIR